MNGPSHGEVKWVNGEPILVEVGSRCHGSEGLWIPVADAVMHCNQVAASAAAYLSREAFLEVPSLPVERFADGRLLFLVSRVQGILKAVDAVLVEEIRQMASFVRMELFVKPGARIVPTINCFTFGGVVVLINEHSPQLEKDYQRIHEMEESGLFEVE
ncbi:unnamed protein product [Symbiodinium microadriaticum]|nr:unnamed protein product [Symbiodinium microadriaticum]